MQAERIKTAALARSLMRDSGTAALATLAADGGPFASHVAVAVGADCVPILLLSRLAVHTANLARDPRASLLFMAAPEEDSAATARLTVTGRVLAHADPEEAARRYLARHPDAAAYAGFQDFAYYGFRIEGAHLVAGFGRITGLSPAELQGVTA